MSNDKHVAAKRRFLKDLHQRASSITDGDFTSVHDVHIRGAKGKPVPASGKWGGVTFCAAVAKKNGVVAIRNSNDPEKTTVLLSDAEWDALVVAIKNDAI